MIRAGQDMLDRAERAKARGEIKGFDIFVLERDPGVIDHIVLRK